MMKPAETTMMVSLLKVSFSLFFLITEGEGESQEKSTKRPTSYLPRTNPDSFHVPVHRIGKAWYAVCRPGSPLKKLPWEKALPEQHVFILVRVAGDHIVDPPQFLFAVMSKTLRPLTKKIYLQRDAFFRRNGIPNMARLASLKQILRDQNRHNLEPPLKLNHHTSLEWRPHVPHSVFQELSNKWRAYQSTSPPMSSLAKEFLQAIDECKHLQPLDQELAQQMKRLAEMEESRTQWRKTWIKRWSICDAKKIHKVVTKPLQSFLDARKKGKMCVSDDMLPLYLLLNDVEYLNELAAAIKQRST